MNDPSIDILVGKTLSKVENFAGSDGDELIFTVNDNEIYKLYHRQDCCENVYIEDITGDLDDLVGKPILKASEDSNSDNPREEDEFMPGSFTWTFYNIATIKGHVTIRWYGTSNGYYSESVNFVRVQ